MVNSIHQRIWTPDMGVRYHHAGRQMPWWKAGGTACIWAAYQADSAANFAASLVDLSGNGNDAGDPGGAATPGWDAVNGWTFDGVNQYLTTAFIPESDQSQSMIVQFTDFAGGDILGIAEGGVAFTLGSNETDATYFNGGGLSAAPILASGIQAVAGDKGYRNGVLDVTGLAGWGMVVPTYNCYIGAVHWLGGAGCDSVKIQKAAFYSCALTGPQVLAITTAMEIA